VHGAIDRRGFLAGAARFTAGAVTAAGLLAALSPRFAQARQVEPQDARIVAEFVEFPSPEGHGTGRGYLVRPKQPAGALPLVLVAHENRGLNPHIEDVARRFAVEGFMAFAPDALFPLGGYPGDEDKARALFGTLDAAKTQADFEAAAQWLCRRKEGNGCLGVTGYCWGGGMTNKLATRPLGIAAAAPFYGPAPPVEDVAKITAELLVVLAADDERVNTTWPGYEAALEAAGVTYEKFQPAGTVHGFHNDTTPRYDAAAAKEAWTRTLALFRRTLRTTTTTPPTPA
jgi:carboxymethylenebutenolidase